MVQNLLLVTINRVSWLITSVKAFSTTEVPISRFSITNKQFRNTVIATGT